MARLLERYKTEIVPALKKQLGTENVHALPKLEKIVVSMGVGKALENKNNDLLIRSKKDLDLLRGVYGEKIVSAARKKRR